MFNFYCKTVLRDTRKVASRSQTRSLEPSLLCLCARGKSTVVALASLSLYTRPVSHTHKGRRANPGDAVLSPPFPSHRWGAMVQSNQRLTLKPWCLLPLCNLNYYIWGGREQHRNCSHVGDAHVFHNSITLTWSQALEEDRHCRVVIHTKSQRQRRVYLLTAKAESHKETVSSCPPSLTVPS